MAEVAQELLSVNLEDEMKQSYLDYAMSVIVGRALPDVRDGLKPVHRRVLYAMRELGNDYNKPYKKSARVVGDVIGKYHPHGDSAVYDTIVRLAQDFSMRYPLVDGQGNFGSVDGDRPAAMRWALGLWALVVAVFVIIATPALRDFVEPVDEWFWDLAVASEWQPAVLLAKALRIIGTGWVMVPFEIAVGLLLFARRRLKALAFWAAAVVTTDAIVWISKVAYERPRPPDALVSTTGDSFPSAHSATAAVVAIGLVLVFVPITEHRRRWLSAAAGWAVLMAASRVYLRAHWFTDVVAGVAIGAAVAATTGHLAIAPWITYIAAIGLAALATMSRSNEPKDDSGDAGG